MDAACNTECRAVYQVCDTRRVEAGAVRTYPWCLVRRSAGVFESKFQSGTSIGIINNSVDRKRAEVPVCAYHQVLQKDCTYITWYHPLYSKCNNTPVCYECNPLTAILLNAPHTACGREVHGTQPKPSTRYEV